MNFELMDTVNANGTVIKVIGVGGAGGNAVAHMMRSTVSGVEFICANTDAQALAKTEAQVQIRLGETGLGAGSKPEQGRAAAEVAKGELRNALKGANMVFITAGMGGGTGTGASPIVAEVAQELGILTVGVVTKPFAFEGSRRMAMAEAGIAELSKHVHSLIVVLNDKLHEVLGKGATIRECFKAADDILHNACAGIAEIINVEGLINVDFEDVKTVMSEPGQALMGTAVASGEQRARQAAEQAIACPLLEGVSLHDARGILVNVTISSDTAIEELYEAMDVVRSHAADDATIVPGLAVDESLGDKLRVTVVVTGLNRAGSRVQVVPNPAELQRNGTDDYLPLRAEQGGGTQAQNPSVIRQGRAQVQAQVRAMENAGVDYWDIPPILRKQAD